MHLEISLKSQSKLHYLVALLKSLDFVDSVKIRPDTTEFLPKTEEISLFDTFYGSTKSNLSIEQIDDQLSKLRNEWEPSI